MKKGLRVKLDFEFDLDEEMPDIEYEVPLKKIDKITINKKKKKDGRRDSSTNSRLF